MGVIEEVNKLHINIKTISFGFVFIMPVWFIDIFLFDKPFFNHNQIYIPIIFSFWLTSLWLISCIVYTVMFNINTEKTDDAEVTSLLVASIGSAFLLLSINTVTAYLCVFTLFKTIAFNFITICALIVFAFIRGYVKHKTKNKNIKESEPNILS